MKLLTKRGNSLYTALPFLQISLSWSRNPTLLSDRSGGLVDFDDILVRLKQRTRMITGFESALEFIKVIIQLIR